MDETPIHFPALDDPEPPSAAPGAAAREKPPSDASPKPKDIPLYYHLLLLPAVIYFCALLSPIAQRIDASLRFPYQIDGEEGFVYNQAATLYEGGTIYPSIEEEPYLVGNYPPLFPWAVSWMISPERNGLPLGRIAVAGSALFIVQLIILLVFFRTQRVLPALAAPLFFLISYEFHQWSAFCRVDLPALSLTLLGLFLFLCVKPRWGAALSAVVLVLAAFTRQTAILAPIACSLSMLLFDRKRLVWFLVPYLGLGLGAFALLNSKTGGQFYLHLVAYNKNEMDWNILWAILKNEIWYFQQKWILALIAGAVLWAIARRSEPSAGSPPRLRFNAAPHARGAVGLYFILAALSLASFAKIGGAPNYALEPLAAAAIFGAETLSRLFDMGGGGPSKRRNWARLGALAMGVCVLMHAAHVMRVKPHMFGSRSPDELDLRDARAILGIVQRTPGRVLGEYPIFQLMAGKQILFQPFIMSRLAIEGRWDEKKILKPLRDQAFNLIITTQDLREVESGRKFERFTPAMARAIADNYRLATQIAQPNRRGLGLPYYIWMPDPEKKRPTGADINLNISRENPAPVVQAAAAGEES